MKFVRLTLTEPAVQIFVNLDLVQTIEPAANKGGSYLLFSSLEEESPLHVKETPEEILSLRQMHQ